MKTLIFALIILTQSAYALTSVSFANKTITCLPVSKSTVFEAIAFKINSMGKVSGYYEGYGGKAGSKNDFINNQNWMRLKNTPTLEFNKNEQIRIQLEFFAKMGGDQDIFTFVINPQTGEARMKFISLTDCGDGKFHKAETETYQCEIL